MINCTDISIFILIGTILTIVIRRYYLIIYDKTKYVYELVGVYTKKAEGPTWRKAHQQIPGIMWTVYMPELNTCLQNLKTCLIIAMYLRIITITIKNYIVHNIVLIYYITYYITLSFTYIESS